MRWALVVLLLCATARADGTVTLRGVAKDKVTQELVAGATIIAEPLPTTPASETLVAITDETGTWAIAAPPGTYRVTLYYADATVEVAARVDATTDVQLGATLVDTSAQETGCVFPGGSSLELTTYPRFGANVDASRPTVSRDRTHRAWIAPVVGADPRTAVTTLESAARLQSAPGIPLAFVQEVQTTTLRSGIGRAIGSGGAADVTLRSGSNEVHGDVRTFVDADGTSGAETFAGGPLAKDHAWLAGGLVVDRAPAGALDAHGMLRFDYQHSAEHQLSVAGLAQQVGDARDAWTRARWTSKLDDNKLELHAAASAEELVQPLGAARATLPATDDTTRAGGQLDAVWRHKAAGYHLVTLLASGGGGTRGADSHADGTVALGDEWQLRPTLTLEAGVRAEVRSYAGEVASVTAPRAALVWDPSKEGRGELFVAYQRVPLLDDGLPGDWRALPHLAYDEAAAGASLRPEDAEHVMGGVAVRARTNQDALRDRIGAEAWARYEGRRYSVHVAATSLGRIATVLGRGRLLDREHDKLFLGGTLRASPAATDSGASLAWQHSGPRDQLAFELTVEGTGGTSGPAGRFLAGMRW